MVRIAWLLILVMACSGAKSSSGGGFTPAGTRDEPTPVASPGLIAMSGTMSPTLRRGIVLGDKGEPYAAMIELMKVAQGETGESATAIAVARYNIATIALELGLYSIAIALYAEVAERGDAKELMPAVATGFGALVDRLGSQSANGIEEYVAKLPQAVIDRAAPDVRWQLRFQQALYNYKVGRFDEAIQFAKSIPADARTAVEAANLLAAATLRKDPPEDRRRLISTIKIFEGQHWLRDAAHRDQIAAELALLQRTEPAFKTSRAAAAMLDELTIQQSLAEDQCEKVAEKVRAQAEEAEPPPFPAQFCPPPGLWSPPTLVTHTPLRTLAIAEPAPAPVVADRDKDGVPDATDNCPDVIGNGADGCVAKPRDIDNDGVPDRDDRCPGVAGDAANKGCPVDKDSDGDGVLDSKDQCKAAAGPVQTGGCPDGDHDGIADIVDACPKLAGTITRGPRAGCKPAPNPKCTPPPKPAGEPTGYACGDGKAKIHVGCLCPAGQVESRDDGAAICWIKPPGC